MEAVRMRRLHPLPGSTHSPHYIEHSRLSCGYSLTVDTCDLKHSRQRRSPSRTVAHSDTESACVLHLFGRARSRLLCPRSDRRTPSGLCRVSSHRSIHPACILLPPPPLLFRIQSRGRPLLSSAQRKTPSDLDAALHGPPQSSSYQSHPRTELTSTWPPSEARKLRR